MIPVAKNNDIPKNYRHVLEQARENLLQKEPSDVRHNASVDWDGEKYTIRSFNDKLLVYPGEGKVLLSSNKKPVTFVLQLIAINYLIRANGNRLTFESISYRELPGGESYWLALKREAIIPLIKSYEVDKKKFKHRCFSLGGLQLEGKADLNVVFWPFPKVPVTILLWTGDDEIPGNCSILFDKSLPGYLHTEDVAALSQLIGGVLSKC